MINYNIPEAIFQKIYGFLLTTRRVIGTSTKHEKKRDKTRN
jgi:hypothetical protein